MKRIVPHLFVADAERSITYYTDKLGFTPAYVQRDDDGRANFAILRRDQMELMVGEEHAKPADAEPTDAAAGDAAAGDSGPKLVLYVEMDDVAAFYAAKRRSLKVVRPIADTAWGTREFWVRDPDGFVLSMFEEL